MNNDKRLKFFFKRCRDGHDLTVAFIGGSITQGAVASDDSLCYTALVVKWLEQKYFKVPN